MEPVSTMTDKPTISAGSKDDSVIPNAAAIIEKFGGIRPMAAKTGVPVTTVQGWKKRNVIPSNRRDDIARAAASHDIQLGALLGNPPVNQNPIPAFTPPPVANKPFSAVLNETTKTQTKAQETKHDNAVRSGMATDEILKSIKKSETRAVQKSSLVSILVITGITAFTGFMLWPAQHDIAQNTSDIRDLRQAIADTAAQPQDTEEKPSFFEDLSAKIADIQAEMTGMKQQVETIAHTATAPDIGPLGLRIERLEREVQTLAQSPPISGVVDKLQSIGSSVPGQAQLKKTVTELSALIAAARANGQPVGDALAQVPDAASAPDSALAQTMQDIPPADREAAALLIGLSQFRNATNRGEPFADDLALLQSLVGEDDPELTGALNRLAPQAEKGVLSNEGLSDQFKNLTGDIVGASLSGESISVEEKAKARFGDLVQVKKDGTQLTGTDTQKIVAQAQDMLDAGDIGGAVTVLEALDGPAAETASPFLAQAQAAMVAQHAQELLGQRVFNSVKGMAGASAPATASGSDINNFLRQLETKLGVQKTYQ